MNYNKVVLVGRLCADPEMKYTPSGVAVANFRIAVDRTFKNAQGERETDFIDIVAWRQQAEFVNSYMTKGRLVLIDGSLQIRQWQTPEGQTRRVAEVVAENIRGLDRPREQGEGGNSGGYSQRTPPPARGSQPARSEGAQTPPDNMPDFNDVPDITDPFADQ